jgi:hypothetical protein
MKRFFFIAALLLSCCLLGNQAFAQSEADKAQVKVALDNALTEQLEGLNPPKGCTCNACTFKYADAYKITKSGTAAGALRLFGVAKVLYKDSYTQGTETVEFYAEIKKIEGVATVTKLRWRKDGCMSYETLIE